VYSRDTGRGNSTGGGGAHGTLEPLFSSLASGSTSGESPQADSEMPEGRGVSD